MTFLLAEFGDKQARLKIAHSTGGTRYAHQPAAPIWLLVSANTFAARWFEMGTLCRSAELRSAAQMAHQQWKWRSRWRNHTGRREAQERRLRLCAIPKPTASPQEFWHCLREEAREESGKEPTLASFLYSTVVSHNTLEQALAYVLANKLGDRTLMPTQLLELMLGVHSRNPELQRIARADLRAVYERDPACESSVQPLLFFKGFQALQAHRIAHVLHAEGRTDLAAAIHSRVARELHVDIHPRAQLGTGILCDHAEGIVIGETARVGSGVSMLHHVTLGGSGAASAQRHPRLGDDVLIGASATLLGNISVGRGAKIGAGSLVLDSIPPGGTAVGVPAKLVGRSKEIQRSGSLMDHTHDFII